MKKTILTLFAALLFFTSYGQGENKFESNTIEHKLYQIYLDCEDFKCDSDIKKVETLIDKEGYATMAAELSYLYFMSISAYNDGNIDASLILVEKCQSLIRQYERKKRSFWSAQESKYFKGMKYFNLEKMKTWFRMTGIAKSNTNKDLCSSCPVFELPPPSPSSIYIVERSILDTCRTLADVDENLSRVLNELDYERSYYAVNKGNGFALVTTAEQTEKDATSLNNPYRYKSTIRPARNIKEYFSSLFFEQIGYYRVIVFVITDKPFTTREDTVTKEEAVGWLKSGLNVLPTEIGKFEFTKKHVCTALVYEYEVTENKKQKQSKNHSARTHLQMSKIMNALNDK